MRQLLILEDNPVDAKLCVRELSKAEFNFEYEVVGTKQAFLEKLNSKKKPDIILSDYNLLSFTGTQAYELLKAHGLDIPFILITGSLQDEIAAEMLRLGVSDYIMKDRLSRLPEAINSALEKKQIELEKELALQRERESERRFATLASISPVGIFQTDENGLLSYSNNKYSELSGLSSQDAINNGWMRAIHPEDKGYVNDAWAKINEQCAPITIEFRFVHSNGKVVWVLGQSVCEVNQDNKIIGYTGTITDITLQKETTEELKKLSLVASEIQNSVIITDSKGFVVWVNQGFERLTGYTFDEVAGCKPAVFLQGKKTSKVAIQKISEGLKSQEAFTVDILNYNKKKETYWTALTVTPVFNKDGELEQFIGISSDITERVVAEQQFTQKLENEVRSRTSELEKTTEQLAEINKDVSDSIHYAKSLQRAVMPPADELNNFVEDSFVLLKPRDVVSGDFYWFHEVTNGLIVVCADCTGHGVPGAFMSMLGIELLNKHVVSDGTKFPSNILEKLDKGIQSTLSKTGDTGMKDGMDISICAIDFKRKRVHYSGAGRPMIAIQNGELKKIRGNRFGLGIMYGLKSKNFETHTFDCSEGDMLYMFSDGFPDQFGGENNKKYMVKRLKNLLLKNSSKSCAEQKELLTLELKGWMKDERQVDDILVMGIRL